MKIRILAVVMSVVLAGTLAFASAPDKSHKLTKSDKKVSAKVVKTSKHHALTKKTGKLSASKSAKHNVSHKAIKTSKAHKATKSPKHMLASKSHKAAKSNKHILASKASHSKHATVAKASHSKGNLAKASVKEPAKAPTPAGTSATPLATW